MSRRAIGAALVLSLCSSPLLWGQQTETDARPQAETQSQTPQHIGAEAPPLTMEADPEYKNVILGGVFLGANWDSHGLARYGSNNSVSYSSDTRFLIQPSIAFQSTRRAVSWTLAYTPGVSISQHRDHNDQYTNNVAGDLVWTPSARLSVHLRQDYSISDNPFERVGRVPILSELNGYFGPNDGVVLSDQKRTTLVSNADVSYRLTRHTAIGVTGGYQKYDYDNLHNYRTNYGGSLLASHSYMSSVYYSWQVSKTQTLGIQYALNDIYSQPSARVQTHAALVFDTWRITPHTTLTLYGGPEFSRNHSYQVFQFGPLKIGLPLSDDAVNAAGGVTLNWIGQRNGIQLSGVRRASDGGGLMSAVTSTRGEVGLRRRFSERLSGDMRFSVADQRALDLFKSQGSFRTWWAGVGLVEQIRKNLSLRLEYARVRQTGTPGTSITRLGNQNLVQIALNWQFLKAIGR